jgi:hypothetical protein
LLEIASGNGVARFQPLDCSRAGNVEEDASTHQSGAEAFDAKAARPVRGDRISRHAIIELAPEGYVAQCVDVGMCIAMIVDAYEVARELNLVS